MSDTTATSRGLLPLSLRNFFQRTDFRTQSHPGKGSLTHWCDSRATHPVTGSSGSILSTYKDPIAGVAFVLPISYSVSVYKRRWRTLYHQSAKGVVTLRTNGPLLVPAIEQRRIDFSGRPPVPNAVGTLHSYRYACVIRGLIYCLK